MCCRYKPNHSKRLLAKGLLGFAILVAALSLPAMLVDMVGDLYATAWFVPLGSSGDGLGKWKGEQSNSSKPSTAHSQAATDTPLPSPSYACQAAWTLRSIY